MDAVLRIQVRVAAREARKALEAVATGVRSVETSMSRMGTGASGSGGARATAGAMKSVNTEIDKINRNLAAMSSGAPMSKLDDAASQTKRKFQQINEELRKAKSGGFAAPTGVTPGASSKWSPEIAGAQRAKAEAAAQREAMEQARRQQRIMKQVWAEQVRDARAAKRAEAQAARQAAAAQRAADMQARVDARNQQRFMKQVWAEQVRDGKAAKQQQAQTERAARATQRAADAQARVDTRTANAAKRTAAREAKAIEDVQIAQIRMSYGTKRGLTAGQMTDLRKIYTQQLIEQKKANGQELGGERVQAELMVQEYNKQLADKKSANAEMVRLEKLKVKEMAAAQRSALAAQKIADKEAAVAEKQRLAKGNIFDQFSRALNGNQTARRGLIAFGKDLQWVGRQLNFNFTLPLLAGAAAAGKWYMANERAWTRVKKVYGDGVTDYTAELGKVKTAMRALSDMYGIAQDQVMGLAASWAAAGATGADLAKATNSTLRLAILGDYEDLQTAFEDLITIQGAYQLTTDQTATAVAMLNTAENMSAANMQDFTKGIALAGGVAFSSGISIRELAAMIAALVPSTGSAANAGNALKTIISNMVAPTAALVDVLREVGIDFYSKEFQALSVSKRLQLVADTMNDLTDSQRTYLGSVAAGDRQINRFITLMEAMRDRASKFHEVMTALAPENAGANFAQASKEIDTLLKSDPRKFEIVVTQIKNMLTDAIIPLIPAISYFLTLIRQVVQWFTSLSQGTQKTIMVMLGLVVTVGVLSQFLGSIILLFGQLARPLTWLAKSMFGVGGGLRGLVTGFLKFIGVLRAVPAAAAAAGSASALAISWPVVAAVAAVAAAVGLLYIFRDKLKGVFTWLGNLFSRIFNILPESLQRALTAVYNMFARAFSWIAGLWHKLNPFDNEKKAVKAVTVRGRGPDGEQLNAAQKAVRIAAPATDNTDLQAAADAAKNTSGSGGGTSSAMKAYDAASAQLQAQLDAMKPSIAAQEAVTKKAEAAYNAASKAADRFDKSLEPLRKQVDTLKNAIDAANEKINDLANTPITGMKAMSDAIFENEMAQKRLRLEIMRLKEANGFEDIEKKMSAINGDLEMLQGKITDLRSAGAGSDIIKVYENELKALQKQKDGLHAQNDVISNLEDQLASLEQIGSKLDLENSLSFDPLLRQIDDLAKGVQEMDFDNIVSGIKEQQAVVDSLAPSYASANLELQAQEVILQSLQDESQRLQDVYDGEKDKLDVLKDAYSEVEQKLQDVKSAMDDINSGSLPGGGDFGDLTGNFEDQMLATFGTDGSLDSLISEWTGNANKMFEGIDLFKPIRDGWDKVKGWWNDNVVGFFSGIGGFFSGIFSGVDTGGFTGKIKSAFDTIKSYYQPLFDNLSEVWNTLKGNIGDIVGALISFFKDVWTGVASLIEPLKDYARAFMRVWGVVLVILRPVLMAVWTILSNVAEFIIKIISPVIKGLGEVFKGAFKVIGGVIGFFASIINGEWKKAWNYLKQTISGIGDILHGLARAVIGIIWGLIRQVPELMWDLMNLTLDVAISAGKAIITGLWNLSADVTKFFLYDLPNAIIGAVIGAGSWLLNTGPEIISGLIKGLGNAIIAVWNFFLALPQRIREFFNAAATWLYNQGTKILTGMLTGITAAWTAVSNWFSGIPAKILSFYVRAGTWLLRTGEKIIDGLWDGIKAVWRSLKDWFVELPGKVVGFFGDAGRILFDIGKKIFQGLWEGMKSIWGDVAGWLGGIGPAIVDLKGPPAKDSRLLVDNGERIMTGLHDGMKSGWDVTSRWLSGISKNLSSYVDGERIGNSISSSITGSGGFSDMIRTLAGLPAKFRAAAVSAAALTEATGAIDRERSILRMSQDFDYLKDTIASNFEAVADGSMTAAQATRDNRIAVLDLKDSIYQYATEVQKIPAERLTRVMALVDQGAYGYAQTLLRALSVSRSVDLFINPKLSPGGYSKFEFKPFARGGVIDSPQFLPLAGEAGPEVIIPLTDAKRAMELMRQTGLAKLAAGAGGVPTIPKMPGPVATTTNVTENKTVNFYGDLSFPNITNPDDAASFIDNLEMIAG